MVPKTLAPDSFNKMVQFATLHKALSNYHINLYLLMNLVWTQEALRHMVGQKGGRNPCLFNIMQMYPSTSSLHYLKNISIIYKTKRQQILMYFVNI